MTKLPEPQWGAIGKEVYQRTYSRTKSDGTQESWFETVTRVVDGNLAFVDSKYHEKGERDKLFELIYSMKAIPAGRHLWATGVPGRSYISNCHAAGWAKDDLSEHFVFTFSELLKGGGVGSSYSNKYIDYYPPIYTELGVHIVCDPAHPDIESFKHLLSSDYNTMTRERYVVEDSREGWTNSLKEVLKSAWNGPKKTVIIDVSMLRPRNAPLRSFGGKSSGPEPLVICLKAIESILFRRFGKKLTSLDVMEIDHEIAKAVVAGGIRRSARMSMKYWQDSDIFQFIECKKNPEKHWSTNISVEVDDEFFRCLRKGDSHAKKVLRMVSKNASKVGEPGLFNSSLASVGEIDPVFTTNPCGEIAFGQFDVCNLGHINLASFANKDKEALEAFRLMTRFLIRATFSDIVNPRQQQVVSRNRRIGVGFFGYANWLAYQKIRFSESHHNTDVKRTLNLFKETCRNEARKYAFELRIPEPIKTTCIAPTGSISNLPGTSSGCQPIYARYFIRRVRYSSNDGNLAFLESKGYPIEDSVNEPNTKVVTFYCKDPIVAECEKRGIDLSVIEEQGEISLSDHLAVQAMLQEEYADNAISYTINFNPKKVKASDIEKVLKIHLPHVKGTTLLPEIHGYKQPPLERISKDSYEEAQSKGLAMVSDSERECLNGSCPIK
jgi:adenosylcobalamin-dependent ribonucleoside-triphosphate reductase